MDEHQQHEKLETLKHFVGRLDTLCPGGSDDLAENPYHRGRVAYNFFGAVRECVDVARSLVTKMEGECPASAASMFDFLQSCSFIEPDTATMLTKAADLDATYAEGKIDWREFHASLPDAMRAFRSFGETTKPRIPSVEQDKWRLDHIEKCLGHVREWTADGRSSIEDDDRQNKYAVLGSLYQLTDCTRWLSAPLKSSERDIPWGRFADMRRHLLGPRRTLSSDEDAVWNMIQNDLPLLGDAIDRMKARTAAELKGAVRSRGPRR